MKCSDKPLRGTENHTEKTHKETHMHTHIHVHTHTQGYMHTEKGRVFKELSKGESQFKSCVFSVAWFVLIFLEQRDQY